VTNEFYMSHELVVEVCSRGETVNSREEKKSGDSLLTGEPKVLTSQQNVRATGHAEKLVEVYQRLYDYRYRDLFIVSSLRIR